MESRKTIKAKLLTKAQDQLDDRDEVRKIVRQQLLEHLEGEGFWDDFKDGFMSVMKPVASVVKNVSSIIPHPMAQGVSGVLGALGAGRGAGRGAGLKKLSYSNGASKDKNTLVMPHSGYLMDHHQPPVKKEKGKTHKAVHPRGGKLEGSGVISSLGIPIVSNLAGLFGLGHEEQQQQAKLLNRTQKPRPQDLEGSGVISDLDIPIVSNLAGIFGLGHDGKPKKKRQMSNTMMKRNAMVRQLMKEEGMTLPQASAYIKEHNLI
jgi:hypothetical protein